MNEQQNNETTIEVVPVETFSHYDLTNLELAANVIVFWGVVGIPLILLVTISYVVIKEFIYTKI